MFRRCKSSRQPFNRTNRASRADVRWGVWLPNTDLQWTLLAFALSAATVLCLSPSTFRRAELAFVPPTRADLLLPARNPMKHLDRTYRQDVIERLAVLAPLHCGVGGSSRSALFAQNFVLRDSGGEETPVDAHVVHFCDADGGETMVGLHFEPLPGASQVRCAEEYVDFSERVRPSQGFLVYAHVEDGWRKVRRASRTPEESCLAQHAIQILEATWA